MKLRRKRKGEHSEVVIFERDQFEALLDSIRFNIDAVEESISEIERYIGGTGGAKNGRKAKGSNRG